MCASQGPLFPFKQVVIPSTKYRVQVPVAKYIFAICDMESCRTFVIPLKSWVPSQITFRIEITISRVILVYRKLQSSKFQYQVPVQVPVAKIHIYNPSYVILGWPLCNDLLIIREQTTPETFSYKVCYNFLLYQLLVH